MNHDGIMIPTEDTDRQRISINALNVSYIRSENEHVTRVFLVGGQEIVVRAGFNALSSAIANAVKLGQPMG